MCEQQGEINALKAELAAYRAAAQSTDLAGDVRDHLHGLADWDTQNGSAPEWLVDAVMGLLAPHVAELDALKAAIEGGEVARFAADLARLIAEYSSEKRGIIALMPFTATLDQLCLEKYGFDLDKVAALDTPSTPPAPQKSAKVPDRIDYDDAGELDDVVVNDCMAHLERLDTGLWYLGLYGRDGRTVQIDIRSKTGRAEVTGLVKYSEGIGDISITPESPRETPAKHRPVIDPGEPDEGPECVCGETWPCLESPESEETTDGD